MKDHCLIVCGDCVDVMSGLPENSVDAIVCDPPWGLRFLGKEWDRLDGGFGAAGPVMQKWHEAWAREALRVAKPGAHAVIFGGERTYHRMACAVEDAGFEIRFMLVHLHAQGFPKSKKIDGNGSEKWAGWGTALKPAATPILLARKPLSESTVAANVLKWGTGGLNIDACRLDSEKIRINTWDDGAKPFGGGAGHPYTGRTSIGRWPPNAILSHHEECQLVGTRRVKGTFIAKPCPEPEIRGHKWGTMQQNRGPRGHDDGDGFETVEEWRCVGPLVEQHIVYEYKGLMISDIANLEALGVFLRLLITELRNDSRISGTQSWWDGVRERAEDLLVLPSFLRDCSICSCLYDEHVRKILVAAQESVLQLADALEHVLDLRYLPLHSPTYLSDIHQPKVNDFLGDSITQNKFSSKIDVCSVSASQREHKRAFGISHMERSGQTPDVLRGSIQMSSISSIFDSAVPTFCRNADMSSVFRLLVFVAIEVSSWFLPISKSTQTLARQGCPIKMLDEQAGIRTSGKGPLVRSHARQGYSGGWSNNTGYAYGDSGPASRFFFVAKPSRTEREFGLERLSAVSGAEVVGRKEGAAGLNSPRAGAGRTAEQVRNIHPTTKGVELMRWLVRLVTPPSGLVLDPFGGSGTTAIAVVQEGFRCLLVEKEWKYCQIARARLRAVNNDQLSLFEEAPQEKHQQQIQQEQQQQQKQQQFDLFGVAASD